MLNAVILEIDETLMDNEELMGIKTIHVKEGNYYFLGYVGIIKEKNNSCSRRLCSLKARIVKTKNDTM